MKKILCVLAVCVLMTFTFNACTQNDSTTSQQPSAQSADPALEQTIVGKWNTTGVLSASTGKALGLAILGSEAQDTVFSATFEQDGAGILAINDETNGQAFEYSLDGNEVLLKVGSGETRVLTYDPPNETLTYPVEGTDFVLVLSKE